MRIVISPVGGRDELFPFLALAHALHDRGHSVTLCAPEKFRARITRHEFRMVSCGASFEQFLEGVKEIQNRESAFVDALAKEVPVHFVSLRDALREADLLIGGFLQLAGPSMAQQAGIPYFTAVVSPLALEETEFPAAGAVMEKGFLPGLPGLSGFHRKQRARKWKERILSAINRERKFTGLPPVENLYKYLLSGYQLIGIDPEFTSIPRIADRAVSGFWYLPQQDAVEWESYFSEGPPVVFVGPLPQYSLPKICESVQAAGFRPLLSEDWKDVTDLPPDVRVFDIYDHVPSPTSAVLHNGNTWLTALAARAGVPQIIAPLLQSQFYCANRLHELGLAPEPLHDLEKLQEVVHKVATDSVSRDRAKIYSEKIRAKDPLKIAVDAIEKQILQRT